MTIRFFNTLSRQKEEFVPLEAGKVSIYLCGPTVYSDAHIGHAMSAIVFDMVRRYLAFRGFDVHFVTNFTDVDDKIIRRANETGRDPFELAASYADKYLRHLTDLNVMRADAYPKVSSEIDQIIRVIQELGEGGYAYEMDGSVYFRVKKDEDYGKLSRRTLDEAISGTRVAEDERKENVADFALWKAAKPGEPAWESPWGPGRPGWHIECTAMCLHHVGETIDIHGGGNDLIFPHHENEIAQSESLTGKPFANVWMHHGMLQLGEEKMSKSLGNLITIDQFLAENSADALRMVIFAGHYRKPVVYTDEVVAGAERSLTRLRGGLRPAVGTLTTGEAADAVRQAAEQARVAFTESMDDDLNTAGGLAVLFELVTAINTARSAGVSGPFFQAAQRTLGELAGVFGLTLTAAEAQAGLQVAVEPYIDLLVKVRTDLRTAKQWALSDQIRDGLKELKITLEDSPSGTTWRREE
ncbi:MAG: cysteine--tRNA ligase [Caldilineaceae bacterium]|nr:cysteine--tRNA ligase [Caldilineaceae bacterium]MBP8109754.1 cysteine--tRNA ligase [Caldilineaceae bacterium]MBP8124538.1 cysteine--tRNA ligase [Caldilineaceae bacterium]MBP9072318.1 cysteine--tRNA ligase [Caldilineaceae bacterium]